MADIKTILKKTVSEEVPCISLTTRRSSRPIAAGLVLQICYSNFSLLIKTNIDVSVVSNKDSVPHVEISQYKSCAT